MLAAEPRQQEQALLDLRQPRGIRAHAARVAPQVPGDVLDGGRRFRQPLGQRRQRRIQRHQRLEVAQHGRDPLADRAVAGVQRLLAARRRREEALGAAQPLALGGQRRRLRPPPAAPPPARRAESAAGPRARPGRARRQRTSPAPPPRSTAAACAAAISSRNAAFSANASRMASWLSGSVSDCWSCCEAMSTSGPTTRAQVRRGRQAAAQVDAPAARARDDAPDDQPLVRVARLAAVAGQPRPRRRAAREARRSPRPAPRRGRCAPGRRWRAPPRSSPSASTRMLLPAPVSPVTAVRPGPERQLDLINQREPRDLAAASASRLHLRPKRGGVATRFQLWRSPHDSFSRRMPKKPRGER